MLNTYARAASKVAKHYENTPIQMYWKFHHQTNWTFSDKKSDVFSYFCSKYRLLVLVRTASARTLNICSWAEIRKNQIYPCNSQFHYIFRITKTRLFKYIENFTTRKLKKFQIKNSNIFHISAQNIDCGYSLEPPRRGGSNEYPQSMFLSSNKTSNVYPCKPQWGLRGSKLYRHVFLMRW